MIPRCSFTSPQQPQQPPHRRLMTSTATPPHAAAPPRKSSTEFSNYGLLITLDEHNHLCLEFCPDRNLTSIHPNSYAPAAFQHVHKLGGGGSGVAVFTGHHPTLGDVVMKHGSDKDLTELFALCTVARELKERGDDTTSTRIGQRIPAFRMIYISPHHLGESRKDLWHRLREISRLNNSTVLLPIDEQHSDSEDSPTSWRSFPEEPQFGDDDELEAEESFKLLKNCAILDQCAHNQNLPPGVEISRSGTVSGHRDISLVTSSSITQCQVKLRGETLMLVLPEDKAQEILPSTTTTGQHTRKIRLDGDGYPALQAIYDDLLLLMKSYKWKCTLGQKLIGGHNPQTGNEWLYRNQLVKGPLLDNLVTQGIQVVRDLVLLTTLQEQDPQVLETIRQELKRVEKKGKAFEAGDLSLQADAFVGNAIRKNFRTDTGRIPVLLLLGKHFREHSTLQRPSTFLKSNHKNHNIHRIQSLPSLILTPEETIPAYHLGRITQPGALVGDTFEKAPKEPTILEAMGPHYWQTVLSQAVNYNNGQSNNNNMVWKRLWTCGLADAGLHNLFLSSSRLWLFDLGEPQVTSVPGFLTKILFSFFHTLGMQEQNNSWVRRFDPHKRTHKLKLTTATTKLLSQAYGAFAVALDRIVKELFDNDDSIRWLLLQYVSLQLVSDASFCLQKWTIKGGGRARDSNHQEGLEKWLWRALWDIYVACDINSQKSMKVFKVRPIPSTQDNKRSSQSLQERQMALIQELSLETTHLNSPRSNDFKGFRPFVNA